MTVIKYGRVLPKHDWSKNKKNTILHKNLNSSYSYYEMHGKDILLFFSSSVWHPPTPQSRTKYRANKAKPKASAMSSTMQPFKMKISLQLRKQHGPPEMKICPPAMSHCTPPPPPTKKQAALTRSENCCFAMQTQCFLRIRAVSLGKKTDCFCFCCCFFSYKASPMSYNMSSSQSNSV